MIKARLYKRRCTTHKRNRHEVATYSRSKLKVRTCHCRKKDSHHGGKDFLAPSLTDATAVLTGPDTAKEEARFRSAKQCGRYPLI